MLRAHRIPFSTNAVRVAIAAAHKGIELEWVDHDPDDRAALLALSGQELVPVVEFEDGEVLWDSPRILDRLEELKPEPRLYPRDSASRARAAVFVEWFNFVWKVAPNAIDAELDGHDPDRARVDKLQAQLRSSVPVFEGLLTANEHLLSEDFGIADVITWPFLSYADPSLRNPADKHRFHDILEANLPLDDAPQLQDWIARGAQRPQA